MCGIAGILAKSNTLSPTRLAELAAAMAERLTHRGPDDGGVWLDPEGRCALAHRRLSIIDVSPAGHQPMLRREGRTALTFNGEIYNFLDLKRELQDAGERFTTRSDSEVLLAALERWAGDALPKLDAMFALGYYDADSQELLLARDIFGEKPLYYLETDDYFAFASELHALLVLPNFDAAIDREAVAAFLSFQYLPAPDTIYRSVRKLPPASVLRFKVGRESRVERYFEFRTSRDRVSNRSLDDLADELEAVLVDSVRRRLISDVPLGAFLSGGVDSSTIVALATQKLGIPLKTFSIGFAGQPDSEHFDAAAIARHLGTDHHEQVLDGYPPSLGEHLATVLDEPNGDSSCLPTYLLSRYARASVTVALSGDGGDELFGGYNRYFATIDEDARKRAGDAALAGWRAGDTYLSSRILVYPDEELRLLMGELPHGLANRLSEMRRKLDEDGRPLLNALRESDAHTYLPGAVLAKVDRMSMQHSLEVRAPLLGIDVARFAMRLAADDCYAAGQGKLVLKRVAARYLPPDWMARPKRGFGLPMELWSADKLLPQLRKLLLAGECRLAEWIDARGLARYLDHLAADFNAYRAWSLLILEIWLRYHSATPASLSSGGTLGADRTAKRSRPWPFWRLHKK